MKTSPISEAEFERIFAKLERQPFFEIDYRGYCLWSIVRFPVYLRLRRLLCDVNEISKTKANLSTRIINKKNFIRGFDHLLSALELIKSHKKSFERPLVSVHTSSAMRYKTIDGTFRHAFFDDLYESNLREFDLVLVESKDTPYSSKLKPEIVSIKAEFLRSPNPFQFRYLFYDKKLSLILQDLFHNLCNLESLEDNEKNALNRLKTDYKRFEFIVRYFFDGVTRANKFINCVNPDAILLTNALGHQPLIAAAKGRNIPVIEVQHGEISRYHPGFSWPSWARHLKRTLPVPDYLLTYGKYWSEQIILNGFWNEKEVIPIGNCKLDMFLKQKGNAIAAHHTHGEFKRPLKCVYTSQKTTLYEAIPFLLKVLRMAECISCNVFLYIRIHPLEDQKSLDMYKSLERNFPKHCALTTEKDYPLYELLWDADIHCSVYSTCIYESLALGTPTAILCLTGYDYVERLIDTGVVRFCKTPEDLLSLITEAEIGGSSWQSYVKETKEARKIVSTDATSEKFVDFLNKISKNTDFQAKKKI